MKQNNIPIYMEIYEDFHKKILEGEYREGDQLPAEVDICKQYFVSRITVQKALQKLVDQGLIIRISGKGTFVSIGKTKRTLKPNAKIGLIMCDFSISYGMNIVKSIERAAGECGRSMILKNSRFDKEKESAAIVELIEQEVEGIILQPTHNEYFNPEVLKLSLNKYPMVLIDRNLNGIQLPYVGTDNRFITDKVVNYLFSEGHEQICFMSANPRHTSTTEERQEAFQQAYINHNSLLTPENIFTDIVSPTVKVTPEILRTDIEKIKRHITDNPRQTCIFTGEYAVCALVKQALKELGKRVPEDISLVTFDNIDDPFFFTQTAYVKQNEEEIGKRAVELLMTSIEGKGSDSKVYLSGEFFPNNSIKKLNA